MKRLYTLPTNENVLSCLENDTIGRNADVVRFCSILDSFQECTVISLDGTWGSGKTFFVKQAQLLLDYSSSPNKIKAKVKSEVDRIIQEKPSIYKRLADTTQKHATVYYDAWEHDCDADPILSIAYAITNDKQVDYRIRNNRDYTEIITSIASSVTGMDISSMVKAFRGESPVSEIKHDESISILLKKLFDKALGENNNRLVIFIDELDRCKPTFAVSLLERIKHYFSDDRLTFVFSVNQDQLQHTIKAFYGNEIDGSKYLEKLFDLSIPLPNANYSKYKDSLGLIENHNMYDMTRHAVIQYFHFDLRDISKYILMSKITTDTLAYKKDLSAFNFEQLTNFLLVFVSPILIGLRLHSVTQYNNFITGKSEKLFCEILTLPKLDLIHSSTYLQTISFYSTSRFSEAIMNQENLERMLSGFYAAIFTETFAFENPNSKYQVQEAKTALFAFINPISKYASYND